VSSTIYENQESLKKCLLAEQDRGSCCERAEGAADEQIKSSLLSSSFSISTSTCSSHLMNQSDQNISYTCKPRFGFGFPLRIISSQFSSFADLFNFFFL